MDAERVIVLGVIQTRGRQEKVSKRNLFRAMPAEFREVPGNGFIDGTHQAVFNGTADEEREYGLRHRESQGDAVARESVEVALIEERVVLDDQERQGPVPAQDRLKVGRIMPGNAQVIGNATFLCLVAKKNARGLASISRPGKIR